MGPAHTNQGTLMKLKTIVGSLALLGLASHAVAQGNDQRVTITGSSIKRIATEGALPVQVITRAEIDREGITTAEQLILSLSTNGNGLDNLASNADVVTGQARGNNGASSANLRGQGSNATLILLNGRRVAAHGLNGGIVDLAQIPMSAVERIEILKDGASAIYGTDAIGGVINFILRSNFTGLRAQVIADATQAGGGNIYRASVVGGLGDLDRDGFNVLGTVAYSDNKILRGVDRDFVNTFQPNRGLSVDTRGAPFGSVFPLAGTLFPNAAATPLVLGSSTVRASAGINILNLPGNRGCGVIDGQAPYDAKLWDFAEAQYNCAWDTGRAAVLQQPIDNLNFVFSGKLKLGQHLVSAEAIGSKANSAKIFSNLQLTPNTTTQQLRFPRNADSQAAYDLVFDALKGAFPATVLESQRGLPMAYRWRCMECGPREIQTETTTQRVFAGIEGPLFGWDYRAGVGQSKSDAKSTLGGGYYFRGTDGTGAFVRDGIIPALNSGKINIFLLPGQSQTAAGLAALEAASARGVVLYGGEFIVTQIDATASGPVFKLPAGDVMAAVGVDFRTEKYRFNGDERAATARPVIIAAPFDDGNALLGVKRDVKAVFTEVILPVSKDLEVNLAVRRDDYDGFGASTNPKASLRFKALDSLLFRGSYSTGFRVPTFNQLYNGVSIAAYTGADLADPAICPGGRVDNTRPGCGQLRPDIVNGGKTDLGPEKAKMASLGFIFEPTANISIGMDWWKIQREGTIQGLSLRTMLENYSLFPERFIRDAAGTLVAVDQRIVNAGETITEGIEVSLKGGFNALGTRWTAGMEGTYLLTKKSRVLVSAPWGASEVGRFTTGGDLGLRWKHTATLSTKMGDWGGSLSQTFRSGYKDQVLPGVSSGLVSPPNWNPKVATYTTYNLSATYTGIKNLTLTGLVKNLLDTDPPFSVAYDSNTGAGSSWEPRVADPRGRSFVINLEYKFF
jgi:iron complex outermembrane recepter protein